MNTLSRYDILVGSEKERSNLDFIINTLEKSIINGTVWDDDLNNPKRVPQALIQVYNPGKNYEEDPLDIKLIGYTIADNEGHFVVGPFEVGSMVILKISKFFGDKDEFMETSYYVGEQHTSAEM